MKYPHRKEFTEVKGNNKCRYELCVGEDGQSSVVGSNIKDEKPNSNTTRRSLAVDWLKEVFLPQGFPDSVSDDYIQYQLWDTLQAYCSSVAGSVSLHATLGSLGVGDDKSTALAATLTWLTNTGCGMIASIAFTYCIGTHLDSNNKQWRLFADVMNDLAMLVKLACPLLPFPILVTLTVAAVIESLVGVAGRATRAALTAHQARRNNLGDVAAKDGSQETLVNLAALCTSLVLLPQITSNLMLTWAVFLLLLVSHLLCNYCAVRAIIAPSLNRPRLFHILSQFSEQATVPSLGEVNGTEPLLWGSAFKQSYLHNDWILVLGSSFSRIVGEKNIFCVNKNLDRNYLIVISPDTKSVHAIFKKSFTDSDVIHCTYLSYLLAREMERRNSLECVRVEAKVVEKLQEKVEDTFDKLLHAITDKGWRPHELYLGMKETRVED